MHLPLNIKLRQTLSHASALLEQILERLAAVEVSSNLEEATGMKRLQELLTADREGLRRLVMEILDGLIAADTKTSLRIKTLYNVKQYLTVLQQRNEKNCEVAPNVLRSAMERDALCELFEEYAIVLSDAQQYAKESLAVYDAFLGEKEQIRCMRSSATPLEVGAQKYEDLRRIAEAEQYYRNAMEARSFASTFQGKKSVTDSCPPPSPCASAEPSLVDTVPKKKGKSAWGIFKLFKKREEKIISPPTMDQVQFSAVAPATVTCGKYMPLSVIMYTEGYRFAVEDVIAELGGTARETRGGFHSVQRESVIKVVLTSPDVAVDDGVNVQKWDGNYLNFEFAVKIPGDFAEAQLLFNATVYINDVIATKLKLILDCTGKKKVTVSRADISSAFVSYASEDRNRVAAIIQGMRKARPDLDIFFDVENLRSGQKWQETLKDEITGRDVLFLCWSNFAKASQWVDMEWRYALERKGEEGIEPIPIESPDVCPPPAELQQKHFNDKMLYIIKATGDKA